MIPRPYIAQWKDHVPWRSSVQVEQDLIISRALIALFNDDFLRKNRISTDFSGDMEGLLRPEMRYDRVQAFDWFMDQLLPKMK